MTPEDRRNKIIERQKEHGLTDFEIKKESGYQGYPQYKRGDVNATDIKVYAVEVALDRLIAK